MQHKSTSAKNPLSLFRKPHIWKSVYMRLHEAKALLKSKEHLMTNRTKHFYCLPENVNQLIACILNNASEAQLILPREEYLIWLEIALLGNYQNICKMFYQFNLCKDDVFLSMAIRAGNLEMVQESLSKSKDFTLEFCKEKLLLSVMLNDLSVYNFLVSSWDKNKALIKIEFITELLKTAALSGNKSVLKDLTENFLLNDVIYYPAFTSRSGVHLNWGAVTLSAIFSGNLESIQYLNDHSMLAADEHFLVYAAKSKNVKTFARLCYWGIKLPNNRVLEAAVKDGCLDIVNYLLENKKCWELCVGGKLIPLAIESGNVGLTKRLLEVHPAFNFTTLDRKEMEGIPTVSMLEFVFDKLKNINHNFDFKAIIKTHLGKFQHHCHYYYRIFDLLIKLNLPLTNDMVLHAVENGRLEIIRAVLTYKPKSSHYVSNPDNHFDLLQNQNRFNFSNEIEAILETENVNWHEDYYFSCLFLTHKDILSAFSLLRANADLSKATLQLQQAHKNSSRECFRYLIHAAIYPNRHNLTSEMYEQLLYVLPSLIEENRTTVESDEITKMLLEAKCLANEYVEKVFDSMLECLVRIRPSLLLKP